MCAGYKSPDFYCEYPVHIPGKAIYYLYWYSCSEKVLLRVIHFSLVSIISPVLHIHIYFVYHRHYAILTINSVGI